MGDDERQALEARVRAGEWLRTGDLAKLLRVDRTTVGRMMHAGRLKYRVRAGTGSQREADPASVLEQLERSRQVHGDQS